MQDLDKEAQRIVLTSAPERARRHGRALRPACPHVGTVGSEGGTERSGAHGERPVGAASGGAQRPDGAARSRRRWWCGRRTGPSHEAIAAATALREPEGRVVTGDAPKAQVIIAFDLPSAEQLRQLRGRGRGGAAGATGHRALRRADRLTPPAAPAARGARRGHDGGGRAARARSCARSRPARPDRALLTLAPLFERHDPAAVAAALYELWTSAAGATAPAALPDIPATARVYVGIGKKDGATVNDLVAVLTKDVRLERAKIGRVELRDAFIAGRAAGAGRGAGGERPQRDDDPAAAHHGAGRPGRPDRPAGHRPAGRRHRGERRAHRKSARAASG